MVEYSFDTLKVLREMETARCGHLHLIRHDIDFRLHSDEIVHVEIQAVLTALQAFRVGVIEVRERFHVDHREGTDLAGRKGLASTSWRC